MWNFVFGKFKRKNNFLEIKPKEIENKINKIDNSKLKKDQFESEIEFHTDED